MATYAATITTARSAADTFTYLADFSNAASWDPGVLDAEAGPRLPAGRRPGPRGPAVRAGRRAWPLAPPRGMTGPGASRAWLPARLADELLEASVLGSFSRLGIELRARLLPEFAAARPPDLTGRRVVITGATAG